MIMTTTFPYRLRTLLLACATSLILIGGVSASHAQTVAVMVNGEPITDYDIEQRSKLDFISSHKQPARQDVINELIDEKVKIKEAKKFGVDPSSSDIEQSYAAMSTRMRITPRGSPAATTEARQKEAEALRGRVQTCDDANALFKSMQNATIRETVTKTSADMPPVLRELLDKTPIGHLTPPEVTKQGVEMVALCGRKPTTVDSPKKKEIRDKMFVQKYEAKSKSYLQEIRRAAMIEYR